MVSYGQFSQKMLTKIQELAALDTAHQPNNRLLLDH